jgi:hypothetical protein
MGADSPGNARKRIPFPDQCQGLFELAGSNESNISLGIDMDGTGSPARRHASLLYAIGTWHGLGKKLIDGRSSDQPLFVIIGDLDGTDLCTIPTGLTGFDRNITGFFVDQDFEIPGASLHLVDLCMGQDFNVSMPPCVDQFGRHDAHRAVIGGERLVELGHGPPDAQVLLEEVDLKARFCEVEGGLDPSNSSANHKNGSNRGLG